jgi:hypothetical protein
MNAVLDFIVSFSFSKKLPSQFLRKKPTLKPDPFKLKRILDGR